MFTYHNSAYKLTLLFFVVNKIDAKKQNYWCYIYTDYQTSLKIKGTLQESLFTFTDP